MKENTHICWRLRGISFFLSFLFSSFRPSFPVPCLLGIAALRTATDQSEAAVISLPTPKGMGGLLQRLQK